MRLQNLEFDDDEQSLIRTDGQNQTDIYESSSIEGYLSSPAFDINFGEDISTSEIKLDMDSDKNQQACSKFLNSVEKLQIIFDFTPFCRKYRYQFYF